MTTDKSTTSPIGIPNETLKELGISPELFMYSPAQVQKLTDITDVDPLMVSVFLEKDGEFNNDGKKTKLFNNCDYIMPLGIYVNMVQGSRNTTSIRPSKVKFAELFKRYKGQNLSGKKLLIWRFGGFGDLMFAQPLVKYLKETYPTCKIIFATSPSCIDLLQGWPKGLIDNAVTIPFNADLLKHTDYHLTFEGSIERCDEAREIDAFEVFQKVANLGFDLNKYPTSLKPIAEISLKLAPYVPENTVALQIRSTSPARSLSMPKVRLLTEKLIEAGYNVGFWDGINIFHNIDDFMLNQFFSMPEKVHNLARFSRDINWGIALLAHCKGLIGVDSAGTHLAAALNKPVVGLYGPIKSNLRVGRYKNAIGLDVADGWDECLKYPCFAHNVTLAHCPYIQQHKPVGCMEDIDVDRIVEAFKQLDTNEA